MKKLAIGLAAGSALFIGALAFVAVTSNDTASAQTDLSPAAAQATEAIDGLVDAGIIGDTLADFLNELVLTVENSEVELPVPPTDDSFDPEEFKQKLEDFDFTELEELLVGIADFDFESFELEGFDFGTFDTDGFAFDLGDLAKRFENFNFGEGFAFDLGELEGFDLSGIQELMKGFDPESLDWDDKEGFGFGFFDEFDSEEFQTKMLADAEVFLDKLVEDGIITQAEADEKLAKITEKLGS